MKALESRAKHRTVVLAEDSVCDVNPTPVIDAEDVAVVRKMVNGAERDAVDDSSDTGDVGVADDVRGLHKCVLAERTDGAPVGVGPEDVESESLLMKSVASLAGRIRPHVVS